VPLGDDDPILDYSDAVFTDVELERIRDIVVVDAISTITNVADELTPAQRRATRYDIDLYINEVGEGTLAVKGGADGIDLNTVRDRNDIRRRVALRFGLPIPVTGGLFQIPVVSGYSCFDD